MGHLKSKDAFCVPGKVQETCSSEMFGGQGADFLRAFRFAKIILRDRCSTSHEPVSSALNFPFLKEVSQNCFVFDVVKLKTEEVSQNSFVFKDADRQIDR